MKDQNVLDETFAIAPVNNHSFFLTGNMATIASQIPKNLSFRYRISCKKVPGKISVSKKLNETYRIPDLGRLDGQEAFADVRVGWGEGGLLIQVEVADKKKSLWCRESALLESDGLQVWVDTRDTHNIHRASKFCHWFLMLPTGGDGQKNQSISSMLKINRSREDSPTMNRHPVEVKSTVSKTGYKMSCLIPDKAMNGWNTDEHRNIGFNFAIVDSEFGWQTLAIGPELPISEDPSLWQTLCLTD